MNQIAASILVLSASICGYASTIRPEVDGMGSIMTLIAIGLGLWGGLSLLTATTFDRAALLEDGFGSAMGSTRGLHPIRSSSVSHGSSSMTSSLREESEAYRTVSGRPGIGTEASSREPIQQSAMRHDVVDDILRRNLPRYSSSRVA